MFGIFFALILILLPMQVCYPGGDQPIENDKSQKSQALGSYTWDFGQVKEGDVVSHDFILKNNSGKALNIKEVNTSCGCTAFTVGKKNLVPGEETKIEVKFNSKGYSGPAQQYVYVNTDDLDNPIIRFIIKAEVVKN